MYAEVAERFSPDAQVKVILPSGHELGCRTLDITEDEATLSLSSTFGIPDAFHLRVGILGRLVPVEVKWRKAMQIGVAFADDDLD